MAFDAFLKINGVPGESTDDKHKDWIEVLSFNFGISRVGEKERGRPRGGRADLSDFTIVHKVDKASPLLFEACCSGERLPEVMFTVSRAGKDSFDYLKIGMTDVLISGVQPAGSSGGNDIPLEQVNLNFQKIELEYTPQRPDGTQGAPVKSSCSPHRSSLSDQT